MTLLDIGPKRILVAEDDRELADLISIRLGVWGFDIQVAENGKVALDRVRDFRPEAMILDLNMPLLDGFGVLEELGPAQLGKLPTLVLTARHRAEDVRKAISLGARDYLAKPFDQDRFMARVARLFRKAPVTSIRQVVEL